jgi:hypothetical protein
MQFGLQSLFVFITLLCAWLSLVVSGVFGVALATTICYLACILGFGSGLGLIRTDIRLSVTIFASRAISLLTGAGAVFRFVFAAIADAGVHEVRRWTLTCVAVLTVVILSLLLIEWIQATRRRKRQASLRLLIGMGVAVALQLAVIYVTIHEALRSGDLRVRNGIFSFEAEWLLSLALVNITALLAPFGCASSSIVRSAREP